MSPTRDSPPGCEAELHQALTILIETLDVHHVAVSDAIARAALAFDPVKEIVLVELMALCGREVVDEKPKASPICLDIKCIQVAGVLLDPSVQLHRFVPESRHRQLVRATSSRSPIKWAALGREGGPSRSQAAQRVSRSNGGKRLGNAACFTHRAEPARASPSASFPMSRRGNPLVV